MPATIAAVAVSDQSSSEVVVMRTKLLVPAPRGWAVTESEVDRYVADAYPPPVD